MFYFFRELASTIDEARDAKYVHGDVVMADYQSAGRGQRGTRWSSSAGENLTFSVILDSSFLRIEEQFLILQCVALALVDTLGEYGIAARVKWPNDIYVGGRKITGVLIDHSSREGMLSRSGVGIGINVNQTRFEAWLPNPTSMALELGREVDRREVLTRFHERLMARFSSLRAGGGEALTKEYHSKLYLLDTPWRFALHDGSEFCGTIRGVAPGGELRVEDAVSGEEKQYLFKEISLII
jgi:BirA family biotin operon repressor/biotin-[acetyl-CoA-carboxylase] ligase